MRKQREKNCETKRKAPAKSDEAREKQLISAAIDLAEKQLLEGTASSQVIVHYLKLGTTKEKLEREKLARENELLEAKAENLKSQKRSEELFEAAMDAMRSYSGLGSKDDEIV